MPSQIRLKALQCMPSQMNCTPWWAHVFFQLLRFVAVAYRGLGGSIPPPEIPRFFQSWAEFPVPWNIHPQQRNQNMGFIHLQIEWNPWLRGYRPQIPDLSALFPQLNLLNLRTRKNPLVRHCSAERKLRVATQLDYPTDGLVFFVKKLQRCEESLVDGCL
jgi:hypothetical protein